MKNWIKMTAAAVTLTLSNMAMADSIDPAAFAASLGLGESVTIQKTVTVTEEAPTGGLLDVMFLIDTTGSMGAEINAAKAAANAIITGLGGFGDVATGIGYYNEPASDGVVVDLSTDPVPTTTYLNTLFASGGGDFPEEGINATYEAATEASWRPGSTRFIIALGDATFKESDGVTLGDAQAALAANGVTFIGIDYGSVSANMTTTGGGLGGISVAALSGPSGGSIINNTGLNVNNLVDDITDGVSASFDEYTTVSVSDLGAGLPGVGVSVVCTGADTGACSGDTAVGTYDRSVERTFTFDVTFTGLTAGVHDFDTLALVDGGAVAREDDTISVAVPAPGGLALFGLGLLGMAAARRRKS